MATATYLTTMHQPQSAMTYHQMHSLYCREYQLRLIQDRQRFDYLVSALQNNDAQYLESFGNPSTLEGCAQIDLIDRISLEAFPNLFSLATKISERITTLLLSNFAAPYHLKPSEIQSFVNDAISRKDVARVLNLHRSGCMNHLSKYGIGYAYILAKSSDLKVLCRWFLQTYPFLKKEEGYFQKLYGVSFCLRKAETDEEIQTNDPKPTELPGLKLQSKALIEALESRIDL